MKKCLFLILTFSFSFLVHAETAPTAPKIIAIAPAVPPKMEAQAGCTDCQNQEKIAKEFELLKILSSSMNNTFSCDKLTTEGCYLLKWVQLKHDEYVKNCQGFFVDKNGKLGELSKVVVNLILIDLNENKTNSVFYKNNPDFDLHCPGYAKMNVAQKVAFHTWIFELTAYPESTCNVGTPSNKSSDVPNGPAVCLYQLELAKSLREWRSAGFKVKNCAVSDKEILTLQGCTGCAFDDYKRHIIKNGRPFGILSEDGSQRVDRAQWASHNPLPKPIYDCMAKNQGYDKNKKPLWLSACKDAKMEWLAPIKFFERIPRFPLCGTEVSKAELAKVTGGK